MGAENDGNSEYNILDALSCEKIARFLTPPKRGIVFRTLAAKEELSQGDLAKAVGSTATALSNLLSRFDKFEYKLLEVQNVGKYRYYKLSKYGRAYLEATGQIAGCEIESELKDKDALFLQEAESSIQGLKGLYSDKWKSCFNKALMRLVNGRGDFMEEEGELLVKRYLKCVELLSLEGKHVVLNSVLALLADDILRDDIEVFMEYFEPFIAIIKTIECEKKVFETYMLVKTAFCGNAETEIEDYLRAIEWNDGEYYKLKVVAQKLKECVSGYDEKEIYQYFSYLLPNQAQLSAYIARCISEVR